MKKLYLLRHSKSSWFNPLISDFERPLNKKGRVKLNKVYNYFLENRVKIDMILTSSAKRALETAQELIKSPHINNLSETKELYNAHSSKIENLILSIDDEIDSLMIVGHNPGLNLFAHELTSITKNIDTCSFLEIDLNIASWKDLSKDSATLKNFYLAN